MMRLRRRPSAVTMMAGGCCRRGHVGEAVEKRGVEADSWLEGAGLHRAKAIATVCQVSRCRLCASLIARLS
jgi:hypothetical protein